LGVHSSRLLSSLGSYGCYLQLDISSTLVGIVSHTLQASVCVPTGFVWVVVVAGLLGSLCAFPLLQCVCVASLANVAPD